MTLQSALQNFLIVYRRMARELMADLNRDAERIALHFGLRYQVIEAERPNVKRRYGICFSDGTIRIRLRHARTGEALRYSSLVSTLCHELAHLRHFHHGPSFREFYRRILEYARVQGIYRPTAQAKQQPIELPVARPIKAPTQVSPAQLDLFGSAPTS